MGAVSFAGLLMTIQAMCSRWTSLSQFLNRVCLFFLLLSLGTIAGRSPSRATPNFNHGLKSRILGLSKSNTWAKAIGEWDFARCELLEGDKFNRDKQCLRQDHSRQSKVQKPVKVRGQFCIRNRETCQETYVNGSFIDEFMEIDTRDLMAGLNQIIRNPTKVPNRAVIDYVTERRCETPEKGHFVLSDWEKKFLQTANDRRWTDMTFNLKQRHKRIQINEKILTPMIVEKSWTQEQSEPAAASHQTPSSTHDGRHYSDDNVTMIVPDDGGSREGHQGQRTVVTVHTAAAPSAATPTPESELLLAPAQGKIYGSVNPAGDHFVYGVAASNSPNFSAPRIFGSYVETQRMTYKHCSVFQKFPNTQEGLTAAKEWTYGLGWVEHSVVSEHRANRNGQCKPTPEQTSRYHARFPGGFWSYFDKKDCRPIRDLPRIPHVTGNVPAASSGTAPRHSSSVQARISVGEAGTFKLSSPMATRFIRTSNR